VSPAELGIDLDTVSAETGGHVTRRAAPHFTAVGIDGRAITPGQLYVAIVGERHDGHDFCAQAVAAGAAGLVVGRHRTPRDLAVSCVEVDDTRVALGQIAREVRHRSGARVVAVTGSAGKTTTTHLAAAALAGAVGADGVLSTQGSLNNETGVPLTLLGLRKHRFGVIEMGMRRVGDIGYLVGFAEPDVGVVVNAGVAHLGVAGSPERIARGKSEVFLGARTAIYPADDARLRALAEERGVAPAHHVTFGWAPDAMVRVVDTRPDGATRQHITVRAPSGDASFTLPLPGRHNAGNAACALAVCHALGLDLASAAAGLAQTKVPAHRSTVIELGGRHVIDDCYNANPASMRAAIDTLVELAPRGRAVAVVGDMLELGAAEADEHEQLGRLLAERGVAHVAVLGAQRAHVARGYGPGALLTDDPTEAARAVARWTDAGDWVLVKASRGMRLERVLDALRSELG
jgi:UDP-N-acetylmuramoyl-tripeptide--D-alanyl-D-alanine ligase